MRILFRPIDGIEELIMNLLITGLIIFFAVHSISIVNDNWRNRMVERMGELPWKGLYGVLAIIGFLLIIWGYAEARQHEQIILYTPAPWLRDLSMLLLIPVFPLLFATYLPGRIQATTHHPMLVATKLWALAHLLANGALIDLLLFGSFLLWAVADRISLKRRQPHPLPQIPASPVNDVLALVLGLAVYGAFLYWLHGWLFAVPLLAPPLTEG
jgi:uncharacterized membrane protein